MLDRAFCEELERRIEGAIGALRQTDEHLKGFWCDGVLLPSSEIEYSPNQVNDKRFVAMKAYTGKTGQEVYELTLLFGRRALSRYTRNLRLEECIPAFGDSNWLEVDTLKRKIVVQLA